jgi:ATP-binding cassette subfamily F protein 3
LEGAINAYEGTVLYVSHDRYFINKTASRILELTQREFVNYIGNYDYYLEKKDILSPSAVSEAVVKASEESAVKLDWKQQKESQAIARKRENDIKKCEARIEALEAKVAELDEEMAKPEVATNSAKLQGIVAERAEAERELEVLYERWEVLSSEG